MLMKNKIYLIFFCLIIPNFFYHDLNARGIARDAETELFLEEMTTPIVKVANLNSSSVDLYLFNDNSVNAFVTCGQKIFINTVIPKY